MSNINDFKEVLDLLDRKNISPIELDIFYKISYLTDDKEVLEKGTSYVFEKWINTPGKTVDEFIEEFPSILHLIRRDADKTANKYANETEVLNYNEDFKK